MNKDEFFMRYALALAEKAKGHTSPNPMVGCVIVKNGEVLANGYHKRAGLPHAEAEALAKIRYKAKGATLYVNLEPCSHFGKTPPCADAIVKYGIKKVVAAMTDPHSLVKGEGFDILRKNKIQVVNGVLEKEARELNRVFIKNKEQGLPYIIMKAGISLDGKIALSNGTSQWITGEATRQKNQELRLENDAIAVGIGTILKDNPFLDCRTDKTKKIKKVIFDSHGRLDITANIFKYAAPKDVFVFTQTMPKAKIKLFEKHGVNVIISKNTAEGIDVKKAVAIMFKKGIGSLVVEGGGALLTSFLQAKLFDEGRFYIAPKFIGNDGIPVVGALGMKRLEKAYQLVNVKVETIGTDIMVKGEFSYV